VELSRGARRGIKNGRLRGGATETQLQSQMIAKTDKERGKDRGKDKGKGRQRPEEGTAALEVTDGPVRLRLLKHLRWSRGHQPLEAPQLS
jgi:hypothetical protein